MTCSKDISQKYFQKNNSNISCLIENYWNLKSANILKMNDPIIYLKYTLESLHKLKKDQFINFSSVCL